MAPERRRLAGVFGRALLLLPVFLLAWWLASAALGWVAGSLAKMAIASVAGPTRMASEGATLHYEITLASRSDPLRDAGAVAGLEVKSGTYTFGIALFLALALAAPQSRRAGRIAAGVAILAVLPAWGIAFDALRQLAVTESLMPILRWGGGFRNLVALGYQAGSLLLPSLGPIIAWMALNPRAWRADEPQEMARTAR